MIELERSRDGFRKRFRDDVAKAALSNAEGQKSRGQLHWRLPDDSPLKKDKDGLLIKKAAIISPKKEKKSKST